MSHRLVAIAMLGSALLLSGAFTFQLLEYAPCKMCLWQRWPHAAAIVIGLIFLVTHHRTVIWLGAVAAATTAGIGIYHAGVEQNWWEGPTGCTGSGLTGVSGDDLLSFEDMAPIVMCDEIVWQFLGLSMAGWNALLSLMLMAVWIIAARRHGLR